MRTFTQTDWDCFGGAERLPNGEPPLINESDGNFIIVVSGNSPPPSTECEVTVYGASDLEDGSGPYWVLPMPTLGVARMLAESLEQNCTVARLDELGFARID